MSPECQVGVPDLEQVPLVRLDRQLGVAHPALVHEAGLEPEVGRVDLPVRQVLPRVVGEENVQEGEGRPLGRPERVDEPLHLGVALRVGGGALPRLRGALLEQRRGRAVPAEVAPRRRDRGQLVREVLGEDEVAVDDREVGEQRADALGERLSIRIAELGRAEMRLRLVDVQVVGAAEQREEVVRDGRGRAAGRADAAR